MIAFVMILITGIALGAANKNFSMVAAEIIEGVSKVVAAFAILLLSLKVPKWLGLYDATPDVEAEEHAKQGAFIAAWVGCIKMFDPNDPLEPSALKFNVGWNIWREMAEIGAFLFPYFLRDNQNPLLIPASAAVGIAVALVLGGFIYWANGRFSNKVPLAVFMATLTGWLATGLFTGGCHEFEEAVYFDCLEKSGVDCRMTPVVFEIGAKGSSGRFWRHWELPSERLAARARRAARGTRCLQHLTEPSAAPIPPPFFSLARSDHLQAIRLFQVPDRADDRRVLVLFRRRVWHALLAVLAEQEGQAGARSERGRAGEVGRHRLSVSDEKLAPSRPPGASRETIACGFGLALGAHSLLNTK